MKRSAKTTPTITDIARRLGVSAMTVSRALTGKRDVSREMREKVVRCAEAIGYQPNRWARSLVTRRSNLVGVVLPELSHSFFAEIIAGIEDGLYQDNYDLLLCHSRNDPVREAAEIQTLVASRIDGLIVAPVQSVRQPQLFIDLERRGVPFVLVDRFFPDQPFASVRLDDVAAGKLAAEFLLGLGHRRIAHIAGPPNSAALLRRRGFQAAMRAAGVPADTQSIVRADFSIEGGRRAAHQLIQRGIRPTAILAANDPMAIGAIYACRESSLRVPEDISIMGVGNIEGPYHPNPFLSTIDWPRQELGQRAAAILLAALKAENNGAPQTHVFQPTVVPRHSTRALT